MILILSQTSIEPTTEDVIDWLDALGAKFLRVNGEDLDSDGPMRFALEGERLDVELEIEGALVPLSEVRAVWFRRWIRDRRHETIEMLREPDGASRMHFELVRQLSMESRRLGNLFFSRLADVPWLSDPDKTSPAKLDVLRRAARAGLATPATLVTTHRADLRRFAELHGALITKPLSEVHMFIQGTRVHIMYTTALEPAEIDQLPETFAPSLFQERVEKAYELRVFYLDGECHAMAIFSQLDPQTQVDFRVYNTKRPNRNVPYRLTDQTEKALRRLMDDLEMETGSLDLIVTPDGRDVFLEVNPVGQFGMVSKPCNYHLERKVAELLIRKASHA